MIPASMKLPSAKRSTVDSRTAGSPLTGSMPASMDSAPMTTRRTWLGADVLARRVIADPSTGPAVPLNSSANTSSRTQTSPWERLEHDEPATQLTGGEGPKGLVRLVQSVPLRDELIEPGGLEVDRDDRVRRHHDAALHHVEPHPSHSEHGHARPGGHCGGVDDRAHARHHRTADQ